MKTFMFIAFDSTHHAIYFEKLLEPHFAIEMIPTPREVTASCGLSLKFHEDDLKSIMKDLEDEDVSGLRLFTYIRNAYESKAIEMPWR